MTAPKGTTHCDVSTLQTKQEFDQTFEILQTITKGIDLIRVRQSGSIYICKTIHCEHGQSDFNKVYNEYLLVTKQRLLLYCGLFYDKSTKSMMLIMESLKTNLDVYVQSKPTQKLKETEVKVIAMDILQRLNTLHSNHYIHCDLKPANIMFRAKGSLHSPYENTFGADTWNIIDFGSMLYVDDKNGDHSITKAKYRGTIGWSAPEISKCNNKQSKRKYNDFSFAADIWSLGLIILYCVVGKQPYMVTEDDISEDKPVEDIFDYFYNTQLLRLDTDDIEPDIECKHNGDAEYEQERHHVIGCMAPMSRGRSGSMRKKKKGHKRTKSKLRCNGEEFIQNYLIKVYYDNQISPELFDLLHNNMLLFEPKKRCLTKQLMKHKWFVHDDDE